MRVVFDIEATNLLDHTVLRYGEQHSEFPDYPAISDEFLIHCVVFKDIDAGDVYAFYDGDKISFENTAYHHLKLSDLEEFIADVTQVIGHNIINYDLLALMLRMNIPYTIGPDTWAGHSLKIDDTYVMSSLLRPDRWGGHSLDNLSKKAGVHKLDYEGGFDIFTSDMLWYCIGDVEANHAVYNMLLKEWGDWDWSSAYNLEKCVAEVITRQEHYGFTFDADLGKKCYDELKEWMANIEAEVEPLLPPKKIGKTAAKKFTPPVRQFKMDGTMSADMERWLENHGGVVSNSYEETVGFRVKKQITIPLSVNVFGKEWSLPLPAGESLITEEPMKLIHQEEIKAHLISVGWEPINWKEKDLTLDAKKRKLNSERYMEAVDRYCESTLGSAFEQYRCEKLSCHPHNLRETLLKRLSDSKPMKVRTLPVFTIDDDKNLCPNLEVLGSKVSYVNDIVKWLTFRHRCNSIFSPVEVGSAKREDTGWLANPRLAVDGRLPSGANPLGAVSGRFVHRGIANIPRTTSLYGNEMRSLFMAADGKLQVGMDFSGLEARMEAHYTWMYDTLDGKPYCTALTAEKPNDSHTLRAQAVGISRDQAKSLKYATSYGAQGARIAQTIGVSKSEGQRLFDEFWETALPLARLKKALEKYWKEQGNKEFIKAIDGRKLYSRSQHSLVNLLFQGGGAVVTKAAFVWWDRQVRKEQLTARQLSAYHDEQQIEEDEDKFLRWDFEDKESAAQFINQKRVEEPHKRYSEPADVGGKYVVYWCRAGELASLSTEWVSKKYNLKVPLTGDYAVGRNWKDCH